MKKLIAAAAALMIMVCGCAAAFAEQIPCSREDAVKIIMDYTGMKEDQIKVTKAHMDRDDGREIWEIEFYVDGIEYEFDVDAMNGCILEADRDWGRNHGWDDDDWDDAWDWLFDD